MKKSFCLFAAFLLLVSCNFGARQKNVKSNMWGADNQKVDGTLQFDDIIRNGELIAVTLNGADTYYEYHGRQMGMHYMLLEQFCQKVGVSLRVEVCKDTSEVLDRLRSGDADVAMMPFRKVADGCRKCGSRLSGGRWYWLSNKGSGSLIDSIDSWAQPSVLKKVKEEETYLLSSRSVKRKVYSPFLDRSRGVISTYDHLFQKYAPVAGWDWRLLAAQCYQESTFDPQARSWVGACGLMQIMPATADELGLDRNRIYDPEKNVEAAARYIARLDGLFSDIPVMGERVKFVLASYNGGSFHVRDAMALARKHGLSPYSWDNVKGFILKLAQPEYYRDEVVKNGYMRGSETYNYVESVFARWMDYRGAGTYNPQLVKPSAASAAEKDAPKVLAPGVPHPSKHERKQKYQL